MYYVIALVREPGDDTNSIMNAARLSTDPFDTCCIDVVDSGADVILRGWTSIPSMCSGPNSRLSARTISRSCILLGRSGGIVTKDAMNRRTTTNTAIELAIDNT